MLVTLVVICGLVLLASAGALFYVEVRKDRALAKTFNARVDKVLRDE